jgi:hypothetical protein
LRKAAWLASYWGKVAQDLLAFENNLTNAYSGQSTEGTGGRGRSWRARHEAYVHISRTIGREERRTIASLHASTSSICWANRCSIFQPTVWFKWSKLPLSACFLIISFRHSIPWVSAHVHHSPACQTCNPDTLASAA